MLIGPLIGFMAAGPPSLIIKNIQQVSIVIAAGSTSNTATVTSVVTANSAIFWGGQYGGSNLSQNAANSLATNVLTNSTTVTATRNTSDASFSLTVNATLVEFQAGVVQSMQAGSITLTAATSNTATITAVNTSNSVAVYGGATTTYTGSAIDIYSPSLVLTNSTTVTAARNTGTNNLTVAYTVIEFVSGVLASAAQQNNVALSSGSTSNTATISSVTAVNSMLVWGGHVPTSTVTTHNFYPWLTLTNGTTVTATRTTGTSIAANVYFTVLEFSALSIKSVNRGSITVATSNATNTATITAVTASKCIANYLGATTSNNVNTAATNDVGIDLTNTTTVTATRGIAYSGGTITGGYETIEFN